MPNSFNSRTLGRVRQGSTSPCMAVSQRFNSRTLGRVRLQHAITFQLLVGVSIHAPWEGCDHGGLVLVNELTRFQFTHPGKGATQLSFIGDIARLFQFTHPGKGATPCESCTHHSDTSFNSRTLGRVRPIREYTYDAGDMFQFTHPGKGATVWCKGAYYRADKQA